MIRCYGEDIGEFRTVGGEGVGGWVGWRGSRFECFEPSTEPRRHWEQLYRSTSRSFLAYPPHQIASPLNRKLTIL